MSCIRLITWPNRFVLQFILNFNLKRDSISANMISGEMIWLHYKCKRKSHNRLCTSVVALYALSWFLNCLVTNNKILRHLWQVSQRYISRNIVQSYLVIFTIKNYLKVHVICSHQYLGLMCYTT